MTRPGASRYFVATTALEEFWDTSYPVVFLGEWCKRYSRRSYGGSFESTTLPSEISEEGIFEVISYLQEVYERLLPVLAKTFNEIHGAGFSTRYWRIVIGPWLLFFLHTVHDKYVQIISLKKKYPDFFTTCLDEACFVVPDDTMAFANLMKGDAYNLQLYSQLFGLLGYKFSTGKTAVSPDHEVKTFFSLKPKRFLKRLVCLFIGLVDRSSLDRKKVIFESTYFQRPALLKLMFKMKGKFWPYVGSEKMPSDLTVDHDLRKKIGSIEFGDNEFEKILLPMISMDLPQSMLEGFSRNRADIRQKCSRPPQAIMSAVGWYFNEEFKVFAAECAESGTKLLGVQHGGSYGMLAYYFQEEYELGIVDKYFSWGWTRHDAHAKVEPVSATKLVDKKQIKSRDKSNDILYVTDAIARFTLFYPIRADYWKDYFVQQSMFLSHLSKGVQERLVMRPHREDRGMDCKERFRDIIPDVKIETWAQPFSERDYGLLVCDHPCYSTTFIESLANNKPVILFANPLFAANCFNEKAKVYWDRLKEIGVAYDDPLEASKKVNDIYDSVDDWWNQPERQEGIRFFLSEFGRVSVQWDREWAAVLEEVLSS